ncbi:MAG: hypothetical protein IKK83_01755 [Clostridia bacterium]|nr:hypothetical protein [Clostridia bacterium]
MDYKKLIDEVKSEIDSYTSDDTVFGDIYQKAKDSLKSAYDTEAAQLSENYAHDRQRLAGDNALDTKNLSEALAARGLARSGESALLRVNQAISLGNALASLARAKTEAEAELLSGHNKELAELEKAMAAEKADMTMADKSNLYDRLMQLERLRADSESSAADRAAAERKWRAELEAEEKEWRAKLEAELMLEGLKNNGAADGDGDTDAPTVNVGGSSSSGSASSGDVYDDGITPSVSAMTVANNIVKRHVDRYGNLDDYSKEYIYKELASLIVETNMSKKYATAVFTALKSLGFDEDFPVDIAIMPYFKDIYDRYNRILNSQYELRIERGMNSNDAFFFARDVAKTSVEEIIDQYNINLPNTRKIFKMLGAE